MSSVARDWQDFKVNFKKESSSVFHTYYSKWLDSFIVDDMEDLESGFSYGSLVSNPISKWCARVEASLKSKKLQISFGMRCCYRLDLHYQLELPL